MARTTYKTWDEMRPRTEEEVINDEAIGRLRRVFQRADRVLVGERVNVEIASDGPAPAWSDGSTITLNTAEITASDIASLIQVHGLNYHEVCHILYTPRQNSDLSQWVRASYFWPAFNMLEDQRIETLLVGRYPSVAPYLTATVLRWLASTPEQVASNYVLVRGRRYLPLEVRKTFRRAFEDQALIPTICKIVDAYRTLVLPRDNETAKILIEAFTRQVLREMSGPPQAPCEGGRKATGGRPQAQSEQDKDAKKAKAQDASAEDEADSDEPTPADEQPDADSDDEGEGADGESTKDADEDGEGGSSDESSDEGNESGSGKGDGAGESEGEGGESSDTGKGGKTGGQQADGREDSEGEGPSSPDSQGGGAGTSNGQDSKSVSDVLSEALDAIENDTDVRAEMEGKQRVISKGDGAYDSKVPDGDFRTDSIDPATKVSQRKFQDVLRALVEDCEPGWERETPSGRLNVGRIMQGCEMDEAFDRWAEGNDGSDLEVVALYDNSGSMRSLGGHQNATIAAYIIQKSVKAIGGDCTSITFGNTTATLYRNTDTVSNTVLRATGYHGGTEVHYALEEAERIMRASRRKNRLVIIVTDGDWAYSDECDAILRRIEATGAHTSLAFTNTDDRRNFVENPFTDQEMARFRHGCQVFGAISNPADLPAWGKAVVAHAIKRSGAARA
jgi:hypothetical protein